MPRQTAEKNKQLKPSRINNNKPELTQAELDAVIYHVENESTHTEAYCACFDVGDLPPKGVEIKAKNFFNRPKIKAKMQELRALVERQRTMRVDRFEEQRQLSEAADRILISKEWVLKQHKEKFLMAKSVIPVTDSEGNETGIYAANHKSMHDALVEIAKLEGYYEPERKEIKHSIEGMSDRDLMNQIDAVQREIARMREAVTVEGEVVEGEYFELLSKQVLGDGK